jgi:hypothetical protein
MKKITTTLYKFNELPDEVKEKALSNLSDINVDYNWWDSTYEDAKNIGLEITSFDLDRNRHAKGQFIISGINTANRIVKEHGETCETYKTALNFIEEYTELSNSGDLEELSDELEDIENEFLSSILEDYAIILQRESEYLQSEEAIIETIQANDYSFNLKGEIDNSEPTENRIKIEEIYLSTASQSLETYLINNKIFYILNNGGEYILFKTLALFIDYWFHAGERVGSIDLTEEQYNNDEYLTSLF